MTQRVKVRPRMKRDREGSAHVYEDTKQAKKNKAKKVQQKLTEAEIFEVSIDKQKGSKLHGPT